MRRLIEYNGIRVDCARLSIIGFHSLNLRVLEMWVIKLTDKGYTRCSTITNYHLMIIHCKRVFQYFRYIQQSLKCNITYLIYIIQVLLIE